MSVFRGAGFAKPSFQEFPVPQLCFAAFHSLELVLIHPSSQQTPPQIFSDALSSGTPRVPLAFPFPGHPSPGESLTMRKGPRSTMPLSAQRNREGEW